MAFSAAGFSSALGRGATFAAVAVLAGAPAGAAALGADLAGGVCAKTAAPEMANITRTFIRADYTMVSRMKRFALLLVFAACASAQAPRPPGLYAIFHTSEGTIVAKLYDKETPTTVANFVGLAQGTIAWHDPKTHKMVKRPLYNDITFHRVIPHDVIQAGDPTGLGTHNCGVTVRDEYLPGLRFDRPGRLAMANSGNPDSGGCQFFITANVASPWNGKYTIFGQVVEGEDVVEQISRMPVRGDRPVTPVKLISVEIERIKPEKR
jgi:peptidyl-prolyl cis-trans isomerase A (cyclophilin A)